MKLIFNVILKLFVGYYGLLLICGLLFFALIYGSIILNQIKYVSGNFGNNIKIEQFPKRVLNNTVQSANLIDEDQDTAHLILDNGLGINIDKMNGKTSIVDITINPMFANNNSIVECNQIYKNCILLERKFEKYINNENMNGVLNVLKYRYETGDVRKIYEMRLDSPIKLSTLRSYPGFLQIGYINSDINAQLSHSIYLNTQSEKVLIDRGYTDENIVFGVDPAKYSEWTDILDKNRNFSSLITDHYLTEQKVVPIKTTIGTCGELSSCYTHFELQQSGVSIASFNTHVRDIPLGLFGNKYYFVGTVSSISRYIGAIDLAGKLNSN